MREEIFASGFRNPFRMGFDPTTSALWLGDVGDLAFEEVDIVTSGGNYGWPHCEGVEPSGCQNPGDDDPIFVYSHAGGCPGEAGVPSLGTSINGGAFAGAAFDALAGDYVFADFTSSTVYHAVVNGTRDGIVGLPTAVSTSAGGPVDVIAGPDGAIYYVALSDGEVRRVAVSVVDPEQPLFGKRLVLKDNADPSRRRVVALSNDSALDPPLNGSADDPTSVGGSLRVLTTDGCGGPCDDTYALDAGDWSTIGQPGDNRGYRYKSSTGPVRRIIMKPGSKLKAVAKGPLGHALAADPQPASIVVQTGVVSYCLEFDDSVGGTATFVSGKRFRGKDSPAPAGCPAP